MVKIGKSSLNDIAKLRNDAIKRRRISSYDKSGDNFDWIEVKSGQKTTLAEFEGAGCITHIWCTVMCPVRYSVRNAIIRMYWDGEEEDKPSVEAPLGDFFGYGHGKRRNFVSLPLQMSPQKGKGFNCWFPMPFSKGFKITLQNDNSKTFRIYYYVDFDFYDDGFNNENDYGRFHAQWRREKTPKVKKIDTQTGKKISKLNPVKYNLFGHKNAGKDPLKYNYKIMEAKGKGHFVGCNLNIDNRTFLPFINWPGEGDDMIYIDEDIEKEIPTLYGTGTEDYVNQAFCPREQQSAPYHGTIKPGRFNWWGKITYYRYHIEDPIYFNRHILATIEHGHDNHRPDEWHSTGYWYQTEPHDHSIWPKLLDKKGRRPKGISWPHMIRKTAFFSILLFLIYWFLLKDVLAPFISNLLP